MADMGILMRTSKSAHRESGFAEIRWTSNNTSSPTVYDLGDGTAASVTRTGTGVHRIALARRWRKVSAWASIHDSTNTVIAKVTAITEGAASANTVDVQTETSGAAADTTSKEVRVLLHLRR